MGRLVKNQWARLIILTAAMYQILASIQAFVWPKVFWDFSSRILDPLVKPVPTLQITNVVLGLAVLGFEWPIRQIAGGAAHRSIPLRVMLYPFCSFAAVLMYQSTNAAIYYLIGTGIYLWALREGEVSLPSTQLVVIRTDSRVDYIAQAMEGPRRPAKSRSGERASTATRESS